MRVNKTIFIRGGALGDFLLSMLALRALCRHSDAVVLVAHRRHFDILAPGCGGVETVDIDSAESATLFGAATPLAATFARHIPGANVCFFGKPDPAVEHKLRRSGAATVTWIEPRPRTPPHAALRFCAALGTKLTPDALRQPLWNEALPGRCLWVHPGSGSLAKNCPPSHFAALAAAWQRLHGQPVLVSFGEADGELMVPVREAFATFGVRTDMVAFPTLTELKETLLCRACYYLGNDSGVSHLASALGIPSTVYFRTTDPRIWHPLGPCSILRYPPHGQANRAQFG